MRYCNAVSLSHYCSLSFKLSSFSLSPSLFSVHTTTLPHLYIRQRESERMCMPVCKSIHTGLKFWQEARSSWGDGKSITSTPNASLGRLYRPRKDANQVDRGSVWTQKEEIPLSILSSAVPILPVHRSMNVLDNIEWKQKVLHFRCAYPRIATDKWQSIMLEYLRSLNKLNHKTMKEYFF